MKYLNASMALLLFFTIYVSCNESPLKERRKDPIKAESFQSIDFSMNAPIDTQSVAGIYQGIFPCNDCEGMEQILFLEPNSRYKQAYMNVDSNTVSSTSKGEWKIEGNRIILSKNNDYYISFCQRKDSLFAVDIDKIPLKDPEMYGLGKRVYAGDKTYWKGEKKKGISFAGLGSEPSWILNIKNNYVYFKLQDRKNVLISEKEKIDINENKTTYHLSTDNKNWTVTIKDHFCKYGLSEDIYEYEVVVHYNGNEYVGCGIDLKKY
ncbi:MAG: copper resistance protein NlpE N-terminal domain-containing protein [Ginsengibacter sp.]